ncbi:GntR family transcriptional regulator [Methylobacterium oryzihabitans]|uniref:GntR family transcriptional regulator n=1 Tax=Methylobacterium oryzihabitans TaxID=2499852 RepID=A0A3S2YNA5_9HYPH|nr:GntR family transcriptional regulator [Methylobacterium oryzihabitans]RVU15060.1 GntR family transcriptional regulator [Methylobacterium oryzihabitans]
MTRQEPELPLSEKLAQRILDLVITGELPPGRKLSEAEFSERYDVSRNTLRETFRLLTKDGLLRHEAHRGVFVSIPTTDMILDIYRVRRIVECGSVRQGWRQHPAVRDIRRAYERALASQAQGDWQAVGSANMAYHAAVVDLSDCVRLSGLFKRVSAELRLAFGAISDPERVHASFVDMNGSILALIEAGDMAKAADAMSTYLDASERMVLKHFASQPPART